MENLKYEEKIKINVYGVDIILPEDDVEGKKYAEELSEKLENLNFSNENRQTIENALEVAKNWGTEEVTNFETEETKIRFQRRSGRTGFAHFAESACILLDVFPKDFEQDDLAIIVSSALCHDSVEDSKGLYNFENLKTDLEKNGVSSEKIKGILEIVEGLTFSEEEQELDIKGKKNQGKVINGEKLEEGKKFVYYGMTETIIKLFGELYNNNSGEWKESIEYKEIHNLENEYAKNYIKYLKIEKEKINLENDGKKIDQKKEKKRNRFLDKMFNLEEFMRKSFDDFLEKNLDLNKIEEKDLLKVITRLSETITALGPKDIKGYGKGDYGLRNIMAKRVFYARLLVFLEEKINNKLGNDIYSNIRKEIINYVGNAELFQEEKLYGNISKKLLNEINLRLNLIF